MDTLNPIDIVLSFIVEIEKLKDVQRKTKPVGLDRYENSAEHSWHVCLSALMLKDYANDDVDIDHVIKMLLIHDLGEIDAGDTIVYVAETQEVKVREPTNKFHAPLAFREIGYQDNDYRHTSRTSKIVNAEIRSL